MRHATPHTATWLLLSSGLAVVLVISGPSMAPATPVAPAGPRAAETGPCLGAGAPSPATGTLGLVGSSTPLPSVSGVSVHVDYFYTEVETIGNTTTDSCVPAGASGTSSAGGSFSIGLPVPTERCVPPVCVNYIGPFGPLGFATSGAPAGFFEQDPTGGTSPGRIEWEADLYRATLNVTGPIVVSTNAPVELSAAAWDAAGGPAPGSLTYAWNLAGLEWGLSAQSGTDVTVEGTATGWTGSLSVTVNATYDTTTESVRSGILSLLPMATTVDSGTASPAPADPGVPVTFYITGSGAAGYSYSATVDPGLGAGPVNGPCVSAPLANGTANLTCQAQVAYPVAGTAFPTAVISNGFSSAQTALPPLAVHPVEEVELGAPMLVAYPNRTLTFTVNVTHGTGSAPYGPACLSLGVGTRSACQFQNGTAWTFLESFPSPGRYALHASVVDRFGENVSSSAVVVVVPFLTARANGSSSITAFTNETTAVSVVVAGGALPITTWWNLSGPAGVLCSGNLVVDGTVTCPYPTSLPGHTNLTVTLRDALGSEVRVVFRVTVTPMPSGSSSPNRDGLSPTSEGVLLGVLAISMVGILLLALRRRRQTSVDASGEPRVEENELERMARGRDHLLGQADPTTPRRPDELVASWDGPGVTPEEWAEWIAALVADGSLIPSRAPDRHVAYRRAAARPTLPTIQFDPSALGSSALPMDDADDSGDRQGGG